KRQFTALRVFHERASPPLHNHRARVWGHRRVVRWLRTWVGQLVVIQKPHGQAGESSRGPLRSVLVQELDGSGLLVSSERVRAAVQKLRQYRKPRDLHREVCVLVLARG